MGTFAGVFTPSILTILGLILFLRLGYVVGSAGLAQTLLILALANAISVVTSISLSAIATNLRVGKGGDYYLISRTLGHEFGGAIGLVLFLAQAVSVAFYCIGLAEVLSALLPAHALNEPHLIAASAVTVLFAFAWAGANWATRLQFGIMAVLAAALVAFFVGAAMHWDGARLAANWAAPADGPPFWVLFALFFPAVTGFTQGVSMSGELRDPGRSLPRGTLMAVAVSIVVYIAATLVFAAAEPNASLAAGYDAMPRLALYAPLIVAGVVAATLSSAMASFLGAPRILQALAQDRIFAPLAPFAKGTGPGANPRRAVVLTLVIAYATVALGSVDAVATVVTMFFLLSYGLINYATFFEARTASPSFRPTFRLFDARLSLLGALACLGAMAATDWTAALFAVAVLAGIYQYLRRTAFEATWADGERSYHLHVVRRHLLAAAAETDHPRDWRPNILAFSDDRRRRSQLLRFAAWIEGDAGFATAVRFIEGEDNRARIARAKAEAELAAAIKEDGLGAYALALNAPDFATALRALLQSFGIGPLRANTLLANWVEARPEEADGERARVYGGYLDVAVRQGCNLVLLNGADEDWAALDEVRGRDRRIDLWWGHDATGRLMLMFAYLMTRSEAWEGARIRLLGPLEAMNGEDAEASLRAVLEEARISAEPVVVVRDKAALIEASRDAALVLVPFTLSRRRPVGPMGAPLDETFAALPRAAAVLAAKDIDLDAQPEPQPEPEDASAEDAPEPPKAV